MKEKKVISLMKADFNLDDKCVNELIELSEQRVKDSISVYEFASVINESFS